jgi:branched-chain amino acid transport system ATP-binding protein
VTTVLEAKNVHVRYGGNHAVRGVNVEVAAGTLVSVAGGNGAGKSTLVNAIAGWSRGKPDVTAEVRVDGVDVSREPANRRLRHGVVLVPEGKGIFGNLTVRENLELVQSPESGEAAERTFSIEEIFSLFPNLRDRSAAAGNTLSGGERQMVAVARALRAGPKVLILDEPSVGLAPRIVVDLLERVRGLVEKGLAVLLVEQNVRAALAVTDRLYLLERGEVAGVGTADEMRDDPRIAEAYLGGLQK